jgi:predicted RNase H-like HicB family nuclease
LTYKVVLHRTDEGLSVSVPGLPGCWSEGEAEPEALENIRDAIREYPAARAEVLAGAGPETRKVEVAFQGGDRVTAEPVAGPARPAI